MIDMNTAFFVPFEILVFLVLVGMMYFVVSHFWADHNQKDKYLVFVISLGAGVYILREVLYFGFIGVLLSLLSGLLIWFLNKAFVDEENGENVK